MNVDELYDSLTGNPSPSAQIPRFGRASPPERSGRRFGSSQSGTLSTPPGTVESDFMTDLSPYQAPSDQNAEENASGSLVLAAFAFVPVAVVCGGVFYVIGNILGAFLTVLLEREFTRGIGQWSAFLGGAGLGLKVSLSIAKRWPEEKYVRPEFR